MAVVTDQRREYSAGISNGVVYADQVSAWNGLVEVSVDTSVAISSGVLDGETYRVVARPTYPSGSITTFDIPDTLLIRDPNSQVVLGVSRAQFGLSYKTGSIIYIWYRVTISESEFNNVSLSADTSVETKNYRFESLPIRFENYSPVSHIMIDTRYSNQEAIAALEEVLYGTETTAPHLPLPDELVTITDPHALFRIIDHGDGTWSAIGPDELFDVVGDYFEIAADSAVYLNANLYRVSSY